jgi:hypothetical protein
MEVDGSKSSSKCKLINYCSGDQIEKNEMAGACSTYGGEQRCIKSFGGNIWGKETVWNTQA